MAMITPDAVAVDPVTVQYRFRTAEGRTESFDLRFEPYRLSLLRVQAAPLPEWTALEFHRCPHCTLSSHPEARCPLASSIADVVGRFDDILSHSEITLEVLTPERRITQDTTAQRAIGWEGSSGAGSNS